MTLEIKLATFSRTFRPWTPDQGRVFDGRFAYDVETTPIDKERPDLTPSLVLATACDARQGIYVPRSLVPAFFNTHCGTGFIAHNASFDLKVTQAVLGDRLDLYTLVERGLVWDTMILHRLLSLATVGHTARNSAGLDDCALHHLGISLPKDVKDRDGYDIRTSFDRYLGRPVGAIPEESLRYAAGDPLATWHLFEKLNDRIKSVLRGSQSTWGYVDEAWLRRVIGRFGPLTHHIQLRASILMDALTANGIGVDQGRRSEKLEAVRSVMDEARERLRLRGYLIGEPGSDKALQSILKELERSKPGITLNRTASAKKYSTTSEDLNALAAEDTFFADLTLYRATSKLVSTYLRKMGRRRIHPRFGFLLETGRTSCSGFTLQNLPRESNVAEADRTIRGCLVPAEGSVFIDSDYSQIELVAFGHVVEYQFGVPSELARRINAGEDIHRTIAATVLGKDPAEIKKTERDSAKPVSFGRPGGLGPTGLQRIARDNYGIEMTLEEVEDRIAAYHRLCPELDAHLKDEADLGLTLARVLDLTPSTYREAIDQERYRSDPTDHEPAAWLGGMLLKVLEDDNPTSRKGRPYSPDELEYFWGKARAIPDFFDLDAKLRSELLARRPGIRLKQAVRDHAGRRPVFTITGRLRANATFCSSRNCIFQASAADGAILGLWRIWRAGHRIVDFVHDQVVVESPADDLVSDRVAEIERLMIEGMLEVLPGMRVRVETVVTRSLDKRDLDPRYRTGLAAAAADGPLIPAVHDPLVFQDLATPAV